MRDPAIDKKEQAALALAREMLKHPALCGRLNPGYELPSNDKTARTIDLWLYLVPPGRLKDVARDAIMKELRPKTKAKARGSVGRAFYVRQLRDMKVSADIESQTPRGMWVYATLCGHVLARAHGKAGNAAMIVGYLGSNDQFDEAIGDYAVAYADQVERDYATFVAAIRAGQLKTDLSTSRLEAALR